MGHIFVRAALGAAMMLLGCLSTLDGLDDGGAPPPGPTMLGGEFAGGNGTASDPYLITNVYELQNMSKDLSAHYALANDIDASVTVSWNSGAGFAPVGTSSKPFTGSLDGQNHTIKGLFINRSTAAIIGLFGKISGSVKNVGLVSIDITGSNCVGGLVGYSYQGAVSNSHATGNVTGSSSYVGGLMGCNIIGTVSNSYATGNVTGSSYVGGLVGYHSGTVNNSYATGNVTGSSSYVGGLVGYYSGTVNNSYATGNVTGSLSDVGGLVGYHSGTVNNSYATGNVTGSSNIGGLVGNIPEGTVNNSYATGNVTGSSYDVGGLVGYHSGTVNNSYATGNVTGSYNVGGLRGYMIEGTVNNSYATGNVTGSSRVGGLVGTIFLGTVSNSYATGNVIGEQEDIGGLVGSISYSTVNNSHYCIDDILINGGHHITIGGLFDAQYQDWYSNGRSLDIADYSIVLAPSDNHYDISSVQGLRDLLGFADVAGYKFHLTADIDLSTAPGLYIPYLAAEFDGVDHTISNLLIDLPFASKVGMFGLMNGANVGNIGLVDVDVTAYSYIGGLVGYMTGGTVNNSYATGNVTGSSSYVGGLVGLFIEGTLNNSHATGNVTGDLYVGGLVGFLRDCMVNNSYAAGNVTGYSRVGGLVGFNGGTVSNSYAIGNVTGEQENVGGLVGYNGMWCTVSRSFFIGNVSGCSFVGGLLGLNYDRAQVMDSYSEGKVLGYLSIGGLIGSNRDSTWVNNCYSTGNVTGNSSVGGLVGRNAGTVQNCFWDIDTSGQNASAGGLGKTTAQMKTCSTFIEAGWDLTNVWCMDKNVTYPLLRWQDTEPPTARAGPDQNVDEGIMVMFDGSGSSDDLLIADYSWSFMDRVNVTLHGPTPSYRFENAGTFVITLNVIDIADKWDTDTLTITVNDLTTPFADAGPDQRVDEGSLVTFDGTASWDNLNIVDYTWTFVDGGPVVLHGARAEHYFDEPGLFVVTLNVTDAAGHWGIDMMTVVVNDITPPAANAGPDQDVDAGTLMHFFGGDSYDNDGVANYTWTFMDVTPVTLHGERPSYRFYRLGTYQVTLEATDAAGNRATDTMTVTVVDLSPPSADAGPDQTVDEGSIVAFNGDGSSDIIGIVDWTWSLVYDSEEVLLHGMSVVFEFGVPGVYVVTLNVVDAAGNWASDTLTVIVKDVTPPVAHAGPDRTVNAGEPVMFDGSGSTDNVGVINYTWSFDEGSGIVLLYGVSTSFTFKVPGTHTVMLRVADETGRWHEDSVAVTVIDISPPTADAGPDRRVPVGSDVQLDGSLSTDNEGITAHTWTFTYDGQARTLQGAVISFTFDKAGVYELALTVSDLAGNTGVDAVVITVVGTGKVTGTVLDKGGRPVEGATIRVTAADGSTFNATTAANGTFSLDVPHGAFNWTVSKKGFKELSGSGSVGPMDATELDLSGNPLVKEDRKGPGAGVAAALAAMALAATVASTRRRLWAP